MGPGTRLGRTSTPEDGGALGNFVVYPYNRQMCRKWAEVSDEARRRGRPVGVADAWIAATALLHGMPLVTHNREHFSGIEGLKVISEAP